jgi:hypothetical protein
VIQRFCFIKLREHEVSRRSELAEKLRAELTSAGADAAVGVPADASAARWDLSITISCATLEAWNALAQLPAIVGIFDEVAAHAEVVKAWTFQC